jgi:hypothetical protein
LNLPIEDAMLQEIRTVETSPKWYTEASVGGYNTLPPNWEEISEQDFVQSEFFVYPPSHREFRQVVSDGKWMDVWLYYLHNRPEGFAITRAYQDGSYRKLRYFRFAACQHDWVEIINPQAWAEKVKRFPRLQGKAIWGRCAHNLICDKCGDYKFLDSSD